MEQIKRYLMFAVLGLFSCVLVYNTYRVYSMSKQLAAERGDLAQQIKSREQEIADLQAKIKTLESGEGVELEARSRLNLQKPDEKVLIVVDGASAQKTVSKPEQESWFTRLKKWLGFGI
jgi:cell division protein FtsL